MNKFLFLAVIAVMPALLSQAFAQGTSEIAGASARQKNAPSARTGGLLNTAVSPAQAKQKAAETNRHIVRRDTAPETRR